MLTSAMLETLERFLKAVGGKTFSLQHGHEWYRSCEECDPVAMQFNALHEEERSKN
jgi:hypothetical protein